MKKALGVTLALACSLFAIYGEVANAAPIGSFALCPWTVIGPGALPPCNCKVHCGNGYYWSGLVPADICQAQFSVCCTNGLGNMSCN